MSDDPYRAAQHALFEILARGSSDATVVPLRRNFENAATCLSIIHLFERNFAKRIARQVIDPLREIEPSHSWYPASDLHLTIKNVRGAAVGRTYSSREVQAVVAALQEAAPKLTALDFEILGPICLLGSIVVRAFGNLDHRDTVLDLDRRLAAAGMADDKRYASSDVFVGNITICRFTEPPTERLKAYVSTQSPMRFGTYRVDSLQLVQCDEICSSISRRVHASVELPNPAPREDV